MNDISHPYLEEIGNKIEAGTFSFSPTRIKSIPKTKGGTRTLTIIPLREKIVQKAIESILSQIWEDKFLKSSHGFRPNKGTHEALKSLHLKGSHYT